LDEGQEDKIRDRLELVVRAFDPCVSCSVHMAEVKKAPEGSWKAKLAELLRAEPVFIGVGKEGRSDDEAGLQLAAALKKAGLKDVYLEEEVEQDHILENSPARPLIFLDIVNMGEKPGKIALLPLQHVFWNSVLSHRLLPGLFNRLTYEQVKHSYILGIQPQSVDEGDGLSRPVRRAIEKILSETIN
ncbi:MAG: hydrogenase maturation protease, partial [Candidatus Aminicenantes bacterium]|nr:hydrogenase maturation protease [Candidatus Aminicenantes bacterium]